MTSENSFRTQGLVLVVPMVSTANLPQLAVDLLISSLGLERVEVLGELAKYLIPVAGGREDGEVGITTPIELFSKPGGNYSYCFLQQRSPVMKARKREFIESFVQFVITRKFSSILLLTGVDLTNRTDAHMIAPAYYLLASDGQEQDATVSKLTTLVQSYLPAGSPHPFSSPQSSESFALPSSGLTVPVLRAFHSNSAVPPAATIIQYVLEGDNREDAAVMATITSRALGIADQFDWKEPSSWKQGLFGAPHDQTLFG